MDKFLEKKYLAFWVIPVVGAVVFANSLLNPFVLDDSAQLVSNPLVHSAFNIPTLFLGSTFAGGKNLEGVYYKPLMTSSYALIYSVFGATPFFFHLFQISIHIANAILVFLIFKKILLGGRLSLFLALIFLVHPLNNESVIYVSGLQEPLFFFFGALALLQIIGSRLTVHRYVLFLVFMALSLLSKETGVLFLVVSVFYRFLFRRHDFWRLAFFSALIFISYVGIRFLAVGTLVVNDKVFPMTRLALGSRMINIPEMVFYYLRNFFFPNDFAVAQHWVVSAIDLQHFWEPVIIDGVLLLVLTAPLIFNFQFSIFNKLLMLKFSKQMILAYIFFLVWFGAGLALHLNILPLDFTVADRWFYFPMAGLLGLMGVLIQEFSICFAFSAKSNFKFDKFFFKKLMKISNSKLQIRKTVLLFLGVGIIVALSVRTITRNYDWRSGLALASRDVQYSRDSFPLENNLGFELINANRWEEAEIHVRKSTELGPWWWLNWNNLGVIYRHKGEYDKAEEAFRKATANTDTFYMPYENLAELLLNYKSPQAAIDFIVETSKKLDLSGRLWFLLALGLSQMDESKAALQVAEQARALMPNDLQAKALYEGLVAGKKIQLEKPKY